MLYVLEVFNSTAFKTWADVLYAYIKPCDRFRSQEGQILVQKS